MGLQEAAMYLWVWFKPFFVARTHAILITHPLATRDAAWIFVATHAITHATYGQCSSTQHAGFHTPITWVSHGFSFQL